MVPRSPRAATHCLTGSVHLELALDDVPNFVERVIYTARMDYKLGVIVIHGIGEQKADFAQGLIDEVSQRLGARASEVCWMPVWWAPLVEPAETGLMERLSAGGHLDWQWLRRFVVHFLADAVAYQRVPGESAHPGLYARMHTLIADKLGELRSLVRGAAAPAASDDPPLLVIAHSLGGHIMSNYIWDQQHPHESRGEPLAPAFVRAETLAGIVTFGCNIPLFALALPELLPIQFPPPSLPAQLKAAAKWLNLYDPDDVLGFPLGPLSPAYARTVVDRAVSVGGLLTAWNPAAHNAYWTDNDVTKPIAEQITKVLASVTRG